MKTNYKCYFYKGLAAIFNVFVITLNCSAQNGAAINTTGASANPSAMLDVSSSNSGLLIPRMTTSERNAISNPALGLMIFNTDCENINIYISSGWQNLNQSTLGPSAPVAATHSPSATQIIWNWNTVPGAAGYKYNTANDYSLATDNGTNTSYTQTGLTCNTAYSLYLWAYNACNNSSATTLTQTTSSCPLVCGTSTVTFTYKGASVTYGTVNGQNSTCWLDRNLGAIAVATAYNHSDGYGDLFQWGRLDDGHQVRTNNNTTTTLSSNDVPGHTLFIANTSSPYDWRNPQNNLLWQGASGINNPCPSGWRIATETELENERTGWPQNNYNGSMASSLKLPAGGTRDNNSGALSGEGTFGYYWTSTVTATQVRYLYIDASDAFMWNTNRANGRSVRCVKD